MLKIVSLMTTASDGGAEFAAVELLDALAARGHECVMVSNRPGIGRGTAVRVLDIDLGPKLSLGSWRGLALRFPALVLRLRRTLAQEEPYDVLLVHYKKEQLLARWLPHRQRRTLAWCEWGPVPFAMRTGLARRMYLRAARDAVVVMAISRGTAENLTAVGIPPAKITVVPNAMRVDDVVFSASGRATVRERLGIPTDAFVVGCVSRLNHKKPNHVVVAAVIGLEEERVHLILAGEGETEQSLRELGAPLGERLHMIATPHEDVGDVLSAFDVLVFCPSPTEGQPRAVILGMLAQRVCLATGAEGAADMISPQFGAITEPENDPAALAVLLRRYLDDPSLIVTQGRAARAFAEQTYAAPVVAELVEDLLRPRG